MRCTFNLRTPLKIENWTLQGTKSQLCFSARIETLHIILVRKASLIVGYLRKRARVIGRMDVY